MPGGDIEPFRHSDSRWDSRWDARADAGWDDPARPPAARPGEPRHAHGQSGPGGRHLREPEFDAYPYRGYGEPVWSVRGRPDQGPPTGRGPRADQPNDGYPDRGHPGPRNQGRSYPDRGRPDQSYPAARHPRVDRPTGPGPRTGSHRLPDRTRDETGDPRRAGYPEPGSQDPGHAGPYRPGPPRTPSGYDRPISSSGQLARRDEYSAPGRAGGHGAPGRAGEYGVPGRAGGYGAPGRAGEYGVPGHRGEPGVPGRSGEYRRPGRSGEFRLPGAPADGGYPDSGRPVRPGRAPGAYGYRYGGDGRGPTHGDQIYGSPQYALPEYETQATAFHPGQGHDGSTGYGGTGYGGTGDDDGPGGPAAGVDAYGPARQYGREPGGPTYQPSYDRDPTFRDGYAGLPGREPGRSDRRRSARVALDDRAAPRSPVRKIMLAAASVLVLAVGGAAGFYFANGRGNTPPATAASAAPSIPIVPGGGTAGAGAATTVPGQNPQEQNPAGANTPGLAPAPQAGAPAGTGNDPFNVGDCASMTAGATDEQASLFQQNCGSPMSDVIIAQRLAAGQQCADPYVTFQPDGVSYCLVPDAKPGDCFITTPVIKKELSCSKPNEEKVLTVAANVADPNACAGVAGLDRPLVIPQPPRTLCLAKIN
jgi:hypothetical protein